MDWVFLSVGGFLVGAFLYAAYYTTTYEPEVKLGYTIVGVGIVVVVTVNTWLDFFSNRSNWFRGATLLGYAFVAAGLILIVIERRRHGSSRTRK